MYKYPACRGMGWPRRILCLGGNNLGCIRFAFQEGSRLARPARIGAVGNRDNGARPRGCTVLCILKSELGAWERESE